MTDLHGVPFLFDFNHATYTEFVIAIDTFTSIIKTCPCNIQRFLKWLKMKNFRRKIFAIFLSFAQNIDCGYTLEPPQLHTINVLRKYVKISKVFRFFFNFTAEKKSPVYCMGKFS